MDDDKVELTVKEAAQVVGVKERTIREWINPRNKERGEERNRLPAFVPYDNLKNGYRVEVGEIRKFLDSFQLDQGHARKKFEENWEAKKDAILKNKQKQA